MELHIRIHGTELAATLRDYTERRLHFALGRFADRVGRVAVHIEDVNGPRGGIDKVCRIRAEVARSGHWVLQDSVDRSVHVAIDDATDRLGRSFARELRRERERHIGRESVRAGETPRRVRRPVMSSDA